MRLRIDQGEWITEEKAIGKQIKDFYLHLFTVENEGLDAEDVLRSVPRLVSMKSMR